MEMKTALILISIAVAAAFIPPTGAVAADPPPTIDWQEIEDIMQGPGDHVVGEEICVQPR